MKKSCELCSKAASMYCDSDQASLCWDCDERVHCANFLVAKHSRSLLCHDCQSPTPWKASGTKLSPTMSVCESCFTTCSNNGPRTATRRRRGPEVEEVESAERVYGSEVENDHYDQFSDSDEGLDDDDDDSAEEEEEEEEDGENQVVPWTSCAAPSSSAPSLTTGSGEYGSFSTRDSGGAITSAIKRPHLDSDQEEEDEDGCCSSQVNPKSRTATMEENGVSMRAMKMASNDAFGEQTEAESSSSTMSEAGETEWKRNRNVQVLRSLVRFQQTMETQ